LAIRLIQTAPNDHFGKFARVRLSVFVCLAACLGADTENAKLVLVAERHPSVIDVLTLAADFRALRTLFEQLGVSTGDQHPEYAAALIDSLRARQLESLARATDKLDSWSKSKSSLLRIASQAALLRLERVNTKDFEKAFFAAGRSKDRDHFGQWVLRNPELLEGINLAKLPRGLWKSLLSATAGEPKLAHLLIEAKSNAPDADRYWEDSIEIIGKIGSAEADELFNGLIHRKLQHGFGVEMKRALSTGTTRALIQRRFWSFVRSADDETKVRLFDAIRNGIRPSETIHLLNSGLRENSASEDLRQWITQSFVPYLLRTKALDTDFGKMLDDASLREGLAKQLATATLADWRYLVEFPAQWQRIRDDAKGKILSQVHIGLQAALMNIRQQTPLHEGIKRLSLFLDDWAKKDTPSLESEFKLALSLDIPKPVTDDKGALDEYFRQQPRHPHHLVLFLGVNPWSFRFIYHEEGNWPNKELLFDAICKSYVFVSNLRLRAHHGAQAISQSALQDMGKAISSILADLESEIAGYFIFRDVLEAIGLRSVAPRLGAVVATVEQSDQKYRIVKQPGRHGRLRVLSVGLKSSDRVLDTATITQSGVDDDRD
jgi:hypothetical protein